MQNKTLVMDDLKTSIEEVIMGSRKTVREEL